MEEEKTQPVVEAPKKRACAGGCCQCRPVRILRNNCLENNNGEEEACIDFINAFKACVAAKRAENEQRRQQA